MQYESEGIEYKSQMTDDIYKQVIAFANTEGGIIILGISEKDDQCFYDGLPQMVMRKFQDDFIGRS